MRTEQILFTPTNPQIILFSVFNMADNLKILRDIIGITRDSVTLLQSIENVGESGQRTLDRMRRFLTTYRWYIAFGVGIIFLPKILRMLAGWVKELRLASTEFQTEWHGPTVKMSPIDKVIEKMTTVLPNDAHANFLISP